MAKIKITDDKAGSPAKLSINGEIKEFALNVVHEVEDIWAALMKDIGLKHEVIEETPPAAPEPPAPAAPAGDDPHGQDKKDEDAAAAAALAAEAEAKAAANAEAAEKAATKQ